MAELPLGKHKRNLPIEGEIRALTAKQ